MAVRLHLVLSLLLSERPYSLYVLLILMIVYLLNQLDRFVLGIAGRSLSRDLKFGSLNCFLNASELSNTTNVSTTCLTTCNGINSERECVLRDGCMWDYSATGIEYEVLAGPAFTLVFTLVALPLGLLATSPKVNRRVGIAVCLTLWSAMTLASSFTVSFWQLLLTRIGLGVFEAVCTPFASSIISDMFQHHRATALGFYNWGIYIGYSLAFAFNFVLLAVGWRWTFRIAALPGFFVSGIMLLTVKEPSRSIQPTPFSGAGASRSCGNHFLIEVLRSVFQPSLLLLCVAGGVRQGGGLVWAYNAKPYFAQYYCSEESVGVYLSWVPLVGGSIGAVFGGLLSDRLVRSRGQMARLWVLTASQLLACPFLIGTVLLPPNPWAFLCLLPAYMIGEVWIGVCLAVVIELVPSRVVPAAVAFFLFVINNIGGATPLLIPLLEASLNLRYALLLLFPGTYLLAGALFAMVLVLMKCRQCCCPRKDMLQQETEQDLLLPDESIEEREVMESQETLVVVRKHRRSYMLNCIL